MELFRDKNNTLTLFDVLLLQYINSTCCSEVMLTLHVFHLPDLLT